MRIILILILIPLLTAVLGGCGTESSQPSVPEVVEGSKGDKGDIGPAGIDGLDGTDGENGDKGDRGDMGDTGDMGATGPTGVTGSTGATGATGTTGPQGPAGENASQLVVLNQSGVKLGYPVTIDRGSGMGTGFYAAADSPGPTFPQGFVVAQASISVISFSGSNCTGQAYLNSSEVTQQYSDVLYTPQLETSLWKAEGKSASRSFASYRLGGSSCTNANGIRSAVRASATPFTVNKNLPWRIVSF